MKIELLAPPYSGHLHPILAIGQSLAGEHEVRVVSTPSAQDQITACGLRGDSILTPLDERWLQGIANPPHAVRSHPWRMHRQLRQALHLMMRLRAALQLRWERQRPDLVIVDFTLPPAGLLAHEMGIHWWTSLPSPCVLETPDGPPAYLGGLMPAQTGAQRVAHRVGRLLVRAFKLGAHRLHRRQMTSLGLPALYRSDGSEAAYSPECILALGVPELEFERRWPAALRFVGPMLCTPPGCQREPSFEAGRRHVLVTCGTHLDWAKNRLCTAAKDLARRYPDWVVHFSEGRVDGQGTGESDHPTNFHRFAFVDYERSLPRYDLVVHHGGAGVMYHALQAGIPSIVYPLDYDQFDHAARLHAERGGIWLRRLDDLPTAFDCIIRRAESIAGLPGLQQAVRRKVAERQTLAIANCLQCEDMGVNEPSPKR